MIQNLPTKVRDAGQRVVQAYGIKSRFVHLEFFVLTEEQANLGKAGDVIGLEVNMRPAGGVSPHMYNYACETDVFKIWADMIAFDKSTLSSNKPKFFCPFIGRRDFKNYKLDHNGVVEKYGNSLKISNRVPDALSPLMGNEMYIAVFESEQEMWDFYTDLRDVQ